MAKSVEEQVAEGNKKSVCFAIQLDESSDVSNRATLFCFVRYQEVDFDEELLCTLTCLVGIPAQRYLGLL